MKNSEGFLFVYGGIDITSKGSLDQGCLLKGDSEASECLGLASRETYMIGQEGQVYWVKLSSTSPQPPRVFGHAAIPYEANSKRYLLSYGGRSNDETSKIVDSFWRLELPILPLDHPNSSVEIKWEKISPSCSLPPLYAHSMAQKDSKVYIYGGLTTGMTVNKKIFILDLNSMTCQDVQTQTVKIKKTVKVRKS